jgi:hypothetical protein
VSSRGRRRMTVKAGRKQDSGNYTESNETRHNMCFHVPLPHFRPPTLSR